MSTSNFLEVTISMSPVHCSVAVESFRELQPRPNDMLSRGSPNFSPPQITVGDKVAVLARVRYTAVERSYGRVSYRKKRRTLSLVVHR